MENLVVAFCYQWLTEKLWLLGGTASRAPARVLINSKFGVFYSNFLSQTPTFWKVLIEKYSKTPTFSGRQYFYSYFQNPSENSATPFKTLITLPPVTISQHDPQLGVLVVDRLSFNRWLKLFICQIFSRLAFGIKGCSFKTRFISSIYRLLCIALWHHAREHIIYTVYSDCVLVLAFAFLPCKKIKSVLNRTFSTESYRNWRKSINILKNNGLFLKNKQKF